MKLKLNLGCCDNQLPDYLNVDRWQPPWATPETFLRVDLSRPWPWPDNSVSEIRAWDILEHLPDKIFTMNEIHRVLEPDGLVDIQVPTTDGRGAWQDPNHLSYWNVNSFYYVTHGNAHFTRFREPYGMTGAFRIVRAPVHERTQDMIVYLRISLRAVK